MAEQKKAGIIILQYTGAFGLAVATFFGLRSLINQYHQTQSDLLNQQATLQASDLIVPGLPTATGTPTPTPTPGISTATESPTPTSTPEAQKPVDRMSAWLNFRPDTAEKAANIFGGNPEDWKKSEKWDGTKVNLVDGNGNPVENYGVTGYKPIEWKTTTQDTDPNAPHYWPTLPVDAANYFFPGQNIDPRFLEQNEYGGWHLLEDEHLISGGPGDKSLNLHPGEVAEGYTVGPDGLMKTQDDRVWVAFGGTNDGINGGIALPVVTGQGITIWMPGTDLMKIALEAGNEYNNNSHYRDANGNKLGPDPINFPVPPIYNAPGFDIIGFVPKSILQQLDEASPPAKMMVNHTTGKISFEVASAPTRPSFNADTFRGAKHNPWKGQNNGKGNFGSNGFRA